MNIVTLMGRLTRDPDVRYTQGAETMTIARYTLAVDRRRSSKGDQEQSADFINCVAFGKSGDFAEKYLTKGMKIAVRGRIQTGSYTDRDGRKVYTTEVVVDEQEFCESRGQAVTNADQTASQYADAPVAQPTQPQMAQAQPMQNQQNYQQMYQQQAFNPQQYQQQYQQMPAGYPQSTPVGPNGQLPGFMQIPDGVDDPNLPFN